MQTLEQYLKQINDLTGDRNYTAAKALCDEAIAAYPNEAKLYCAKARVFWWEGHMTNLLAEFDTLLNKAVSLDTHYAEPYKMWAVTQSIKGNADKAIQFFTKALEADPTDKEAHLLRGQERLSIKDYQGAIEDCSACISSFPTENLNLVQKDMLADAYERRGKARQALNQREEALHDFQKVIELKPEYDYIKQNIEQLQKELGR